MSTLREEVERAMREEASSEDSDCIWIENAVAVAVALIESERLKERQRAAKIARLHNVCSVTSHGRPDGYRDSCHDVVAAAILRDGGADGEGGER